MACKFRYKNSRVWWLKWYSAGTPHYESTHTHDARIAGYLLAKKEKELAEGKVPGFMRDITLKNALTEYWNESKIYRTQKAYATQHATTNAFLVKNGNVNLKSITGKNIEAYLIWRIQECSITMTTRNSILRGLRALFNWCIQKEYLARNPTAGIKKIKVPSSPPKYLSWDQAYKVLMAAKRTDLYPLVATALYSGLRRGELFNLEWQDIDFKNRRIHVLNKPGFTTKSKEPRDVRLNRRLSKILQRYRKTAGYCFDKRNFRKRFAAIAAAAGVRPSIHALRHTLGTHLLSDAVLDYMKQISRAYGHAEIRTTKDYAKLTPQVLDHMIDGLNFEAKEKRKSATPPKS